RRSSAKTPRTAAGPCWRPCRRCTGPMRAAGSRWPRSRCAEPCPPCPPRGR
ncbi:hypothetical protein, partial [Streptomyces xanthophaeus]|uniref:hypothetical protein n=1 Tax=Streptomyces xanthophaeus TaxID=67385 RepID=UPI00364F89DA